MIFLLPTRSTRRYRGKYPDRVNSWSYSNSPSQRTIAAFLGISRPVHVELNDGRRYIIDMKALRPDALRLSVDMVNCLSPDVMFVESAWQELSRQRYDEMLKIIGDLREGGKTWWLN